MACDCIDEYLERARRIDHRMKKRDYYHSFPMVFLLKNIFPEFFSCFMVLRVEKQKYPSSFREIRMLRDNTVPLPRDSFSERLLEQIDKGNFPVVIFPETNVARNAVRENGINTARMDVTIREYLEWVDDEWYCDFIPVDIRNALDENFGDIIKS